MPPKSKAQARLMRARCAGKATKATGLSRAKACEFVEGHPTQKLPERKRKKHRVRRAR